MVLLKLPTRFSIGLLCSNPAAPTHVSCNPLQQLQTSAGSLAVIFQPAFLPFIFEVAYLRSVPM